MLKITVNGKPRTVRSAPDTPLLSVSRKELGVLTPKFGCGLAQCGACSVLLDGAEIRSCVTAVAAAAGREVPTGGGLPGRGGQNNRASQRPPKAACIRYRKRGSNSRYRSAVTASSA